MRSLLGVALGLMAGVVTLRQPSLCDARQPNAELCKLQGQVAGSVCRSGAQGQSAGPGC